MESFLSIFGVLRHFLSKANPAIMPWCFGLLALLLVLAILHHKWRDDSYMLGKWRLLALLPMLAGAVHYIIYVLVLGGVGVLYLPVYLIAFFSLIPMILARRKIGYRIFSCFVGLLSVAIMAVTIVMYPHTAFFIRQNYTESFHSAVKELDRHYILKDWKGIDFSALEQKYLPRIEEAEQEQNVVKFADAIKDFALELHDGHVHVGYSRELDLSQSQYKQHEYGLGLIPLDNGKIIAVCTTEEASKLGIEDGTVITKWGGKPIAQAVKEDVRCTGSPVQKNEDILRTINLAGVGGDTVEVAFLDKSGKEKTATLSDLGEMHTLQETLDIFSAATAQEKITDAYDEYEYFITKMLDDKCGYMLVEAEDTGDMVSDLLGYFTGNHKQVRETFREKLRGLKSQGMEYLVIDLRGNGGGYHEIGMALTELFTDKEYYGRGFGTYKNGAYTCVADHYIHGDGEFADLKVVALVNYSCASAGDGTALYLSRLPNVTLAGITDPCGCGQETGGAIELTGDLIEISYPTGLFLDENGNPNIDTAADRISRNPVEERIPFDMDAAMKMFRDKEDYELDWAVSYLESNQ